MTTSLTSASKAAFDPGMISVFKKGLMARNVEMVQKALQSGVDPETPLFGGRHVLDMLINQSYERNGRAKEAGLSEDQFEENTNKIIDLLFAKGLRVAEPQKYETDDFEYLADQLLLGEEQAAISNVVLHAIYETLDDGDAGYQPSIIGQVNKFLSDMDAQDGDDFKSMVCMALNMLEAVHETVRARLAHPRTEIEKKLVREFEDDLGYWKGPFPRPSLNHVLANIEVGAPKAANDSKPAAGPKTQAPQQQQQQQQPKAAADDKFAEMVAKYVQVLPKKEWGQVLKEINSEFVGLDAIKANAQKIVLRQQFDAARETNGLANSQQNHSTVFLGNPGLGKTTFARKKAELLHALGLSGPNYVEVSRENIVGGFIGHTENKMTALFEAADIIFIDEAYSLNDGRPDSGDFGKKVIDALVPALENNPKLTVFMAGYPEEMDKLIACNPGLRSRLTRYETFEDMNKEQLGQTLDHMLAKEGLTIDADAREKVLQELDKSREALGKRNFGNARLVRNVVRQLPELMADRIFGSQSGSLLVQCPDKDALQRATLADINAMDFSAVLGTPKAAASEKEAWEPSIGFGAKLKNMGPKKG